MPQLTAIITCKGRLDHLKQTLPALMVSPELEVVVVDYDCPDHAGDWVRGTWPTARVVAVSDRPVFNRSEAKNLGAAAASGDWLVFIDADIRVSETFAQDVQARLQPGVFLLADPRPGDLWGALVVSRADFALCEGYDEAMVGYGSEDVDIISRLMIAGVREAGFPSLNFGVIPHDAALRTRYHDLTDIDLSASINGFYRTAKNDLLRQGVTMDLEGRRKLYAEVVRGFATPGGLKSFQLAFRRTLIPGQTVEATLRYELKPTQPEDAESERTLPPRR
jgi:glycosyltransferase involved in cell wall biosynthesis